MALKFKWHKETIIDASDAQDIFDKLRTHNPKYVAFDTETTGLNIGKDKPFFFQFGWLNTEENENNKIGEMWGYAYGVDLEYTPELAIKVIRSWHNYLKGRGDEILYIGANIKFDMHMSHNIGLDIPKTIPLTELQVWIRHAHDALQKKEGGPSLALKEYSIKYIDRRAREHDKLLQVERGSIASAHNLRLRQMLNEAKCELPEKIKGKFRSFTQGALDMLFKDPVFESDDLPEDMRIVYNKWKSELPDYLRRRVLSVVDKEDVPYNVLNRTLLCRYGLEDIVWTLEIFWQCKPVAEARKNTKAIYDVENPSIWPIYRIESVGFKTDRAYLDESRIKLKQYILRLREEMFEHVGREFKVSQSAFIKDMLIVEYGLDITSTEKKELNKLMSTLKKNGGHEDAVKTIEYIQELRTLEKWYSAYIMRFKTELDYYNDDRVYTQFNSVGTVSGRFTSSMQQMPKDGIVTREGEEIFNPRQMVIVPKDEGFAGMAIIDFANEEMRFQAMYTILCGDPDLNLCRAFMPYKCHRKDGTIYDYYNKQHLKEWNTGDWYYDESPEELWKPTDLHSVMTENCGFDKQFCKNELIEKGSLPEDPEEQKEAINKLFKHYRNTVGKVLNFSKSYGSGLGAIINFFPEFTLERCKQINDAYYRTYPGLKTYHAYCKYLCENQDYAENLFFVKYYNISSHKCKNMLIQGSAASFLKVKIIEIDNYIQSNNLKSVMLASIHDEIDFYIWPGEEHHIEAIQAIMENWEDALVPIVAEPDYGTESWAKTKDKSYYKWKELQDIS